MFRVLGFAKACSNSLLSAMSLDCQAAQIQNVGAKASSQPTRYPAM